MKQFLLATVAVLALAAPAMAFTNQRPGVELYNGTMSLTCRPEGFERGDRDPVVRTYINLDLDGQNDFAAKSFTVRHELLSGRIVDRDDQYSGRVSTEPSIARWYWFGTLDRNPSIQMKAILHHSITLGWRYQETIFKNGHVDHVIPEIDCSVQEAGE